MMVYLDVSYLILNIIEVNMQIATELLMDVGITVETAENGCGMHPGLVQYINNYLQSNDWMANVGGAMHGHPMGTLSGGLAMRQAIDGQTTGIEYLKAIEKWGNKEFNPDLNYRIF